MIIPGVQCDTCAKFMNLLTCEVIQLRGISQVTIPQVCQPQLPSLLQIAQHGLVEEKSYEFCSLKCLIEWANTHEWKEYASAAPKEKP